MESQTRRPLVGMDGSVQEGRRTPSPAAVLELLKPITWFAPMWALACGVVSTGLPVLERWPWVLGSILLAGPLVCGTSQVVNDWFDRHVDAINEPEAADTFGPRRPDAAPCTSPLLWTLALAARFRLRSDSGSFVASAASGLALAWAYSAPPFRLKQNGWFGNAAVGLCYEGSALVHGRRGGWLSSGLPATGAF